MILDKSYREDIIDLICQTDETYFDQIGRTVQDILDDTNLVDRMWSLYQKSIEDYGLSEQEAYNDCLSECLDIQLPPCEECRVITMPAYNGQFVIKLYEKAISPHVDISFVHENENPEKVQPTFRLQQNIQTSGPCLRSFLWADPNKLESFIQLFGNPNAD